MGSFRNSTKGQEGERRATGTAVRAAVTARSARDFHWKVVERILGIVTAPQRKGVRDVAGGGMGGDEGAG